MHIVKLQDDASESGFYEEAASVLERGGLVCFPCNGKYRLAADLTDRDAVINLYQSKRRVGKAPALVFVSDQEMLNIVAADVSARARRLMDAFWPGPLTIQFEANPNLPRKVIKQLVRANGHIGVRIPEDPIALGIVKAFGGPLVISSANRENKPGDGSPAQIRKNFVHRVDLFVDAGDLKAEAPSTVVRLDGDHVRVARAGAISEDSLETAAAG
jgi:L-threonylcarbamoyladenylate synthase